ncbi:glycine receptor subunit alpha-4-like [Apostichopus japonicus]|uniref:glycine receptor subunit alpha-4-like n=1 Tax=Stichopus japonicus TaxID=307972 RepID=UPI003AB26E3F
MFVLVLLLVLSIKSCSTMAVDNLVERDFEKQNRTTSLWKELFENYDRRMRPYFGTDTPVDVNVSLGIINFESISETTLDFTVNVYLVQYWIDPRLRYTAPFELPPTSHLNNELWLPDLIFINSKMATLHQITLENRVVQISSNGLVYLSQRLRLVLACAMDFTYFPFDEQLCPIEMTSFEHITEDLRFHFEERPIFVFQENLQLPQFKIRGASTWDCIVAFTIGNVSCVRAIFFFHREYRYYLLHSIVPSVMLVMLSWVSFMIDITSVSARVSLGVTTVLTMLTTTIGIQNDLPKVAYVKAIDVWFVVNLIYVIGALMEYAVVHFIAIHLPSTKYLQATKRYEKQLRADADVCNMDNDDTGKETNEAAKPAFVNDSTWLGCFFRTHFNKTFEDGPSYRDALNQYYHRIASKIDQCCRFIFPTSYAVFVTLFFFIGTPELEKPDMLSSELSDLSGKILNLLVKRTLT